MTTSPDPAEGRSLPDQSIVPDSSWRALARATYDQAVEIMENPPTLGTMRDLFDHRLGTYGQAYEVMNLGEAYIEIERLRAWLRLIVGVREDHAGEYAGRALDGEPALERDTFARPSDEEGA